MTKPTPIPIRPFDDPSKGEQESVHDVYEDIAGHFAQTRYKPWPIIESFLLSLPPHSLGIDLGAGNGKYLPTALKAGLEMIAVDRSFGLLKIAKDLVGDKGDCVRGDLCGKSWRGVFDFAISIAAIHHLSTHLRRLDAVRTLISTLQLNSQPPYSRFMIYVWAYEQGSSSRRKMDLEVKEQDVLVPWVIPSQSSRSKRATTEIEIVTNDQKVSSEKQKVYHRYYHLFVQGELHQLVVDAARAEGFDHIDDDHEQPTGGDHGELRNTENEKRRWMRIRRQGWEKDNWWLEAEVGLRS
ncbi:hypothetical protein TREMEDRAFT_36141 [Tremella mesenterica DSM 1558]|uniref:uncharacterized protein n=1 Tax=Tremella mesenterica (strain ATCC 24925 / CBS 8224 / DSM 1558 / NBRC 9311 / NRRL Y-6157 / RJB 2259-6 / UBC 559-6) TaxID=578456 RepID=UPI00032C0DCF|nr:uncharacterized protein TREMEDRAFT_36141 [Tremella mesenterica DSM 1558]EIW65650.1 hypothetical protein TREMEDRAFT_36141 [Tremella mesenterica DSM 1558]